MKWIAVAASICLPLLAISMILITFMATIVCLFAGYTMIDSLGQHFMIW